MTNPNQLCDVLLFVCSKIITHQYHTEEKLFDQLVPPVLHYSSEIWSLNEGKYIEKKKKKKKKYKRSFYEKF